MKLCKSQFSVMACYKNVHNNPQSEVLLKSNWLQLRSPTSTSIPQ